MNERQVFERLDECVTVQEVHLSLPSPLQSFLWCVKTFFRLMYKLLLFPINYYFFFIGDFRETIKENTTRSRRSS